VLVSGAGTTLQALLDASTDPAYGARVVAVGADRPGVGGLARAERAGVPTFVCPPAAHPDRAAWDDALAAAVQAYQPDLVVCAGFMRILGASTLERLGGRVVNTHPSLLPAFVGASAVRDALAYGVRVSGATVHLVTPELDAGPVLAQVAVPVHADDDEATLHARIQVAERAMLVDTVGRMAREGYRVQGRKVHLG